jgi:CheY-like chemotaxis protein
MKRALIVDDSRLARAVLSRLLTEHGVAADTAESAEVALDYLKHSRPDVVFLDHNMPGIDGFEALEAIKTNPATATIPVMMYTSQEGELYVGQARALGALGVLPKTLQPVEVAQVLRTLRLIPGPVEQVADATAAASSSGAKPAGRPLDADSLRQLLESLFSEHASSLREEMRRELQRFSAATSAASAPPAPAPAAPVVAPLRPPGPIEQRGTALHPDRTLKIASALLIVVAAVLGYLYFATRTSLDEANELTRQLANDTATISGARASTVAASQPPRASNTNVLTVLEWGINQGGRYEFGAIPLDDGRAAVVSGLFAQLEQLGFVGTVAIDVHVGRFCMNYRADGTLELAPPQQPAATCEQVGWPELEGVALGQRQSLAFANTVASATAKNPRLRVENVSRGSTLPAVDYPLADYALTAGAWNTVAAANHRVSLQLIPDTDTRGGARR